MKQLTKDKFPKYTSSSYNSIPEKQANQKVGEKRPKQTFLHRKQETHKKMLNIIHY